ncbi:MAG: alpha/beta hydrolase [Sideroxydans sp.]|nr:alpha/beta hydrolase [Sideroxydans sp.]
MNSHCLPPAYDFLQYIFVQGHKLKIKLAIIAFTLLMLSGCASLLNRSVEKVGERKVEFAMTRHDTQSVVFENGLGGRMEWWEKVLPQISADTTTFAYNRPGLGASEATAMPRDGAHIVDELRALLRGKGLTPPYVLVGHSLGGLYMQLFARRYPEEVSALILIDSTHPKQLEGVGALENQSLWVRTALGIMVTGVAEEELALLSRTGEQVLSLPVPSNLPVFVLSAAEPLTEHSSVADDANEKRKDIARLYPGAKQMWVESGHAIPLEKPEAVVQAIREAIRLGKNKQ